MSKKQAFISHIAEDAAPAARLKGALDRDFLGHLHICLLSDEGSATAGSGWLDAVEAALRNSALLLTLCRPASVRRPWINFEAGAAWMLAVPIIPVCHAGLRPCDLPPPLSFRQGLSLDDPEDLHRLYVRIAEVLACRVPARSFRSLVRELTARGVPAADRAGPEPSHLLDGATNGTLWHDAHAPPGDTHYSNGSEASEAGHAPERTADAPRAEPRARTRKPKSDVDTRPRPRTG